MPDPAESPTPAPSEPEQHATGAASAGSAGNGVNGSLDAEVRARVGKLFGGMSPVHLTESVLDWAMHLAMSPGKQIALAKSAVDKAGQLGS